MIALSILLDTTSAAPVGEVAEAVLHLLYSAALTKAQASLIKTHLDRILSSNEAPSPQLASGVPVDGFYYLLATEILDIAEALVKSSYSWASAKRSMYQVMLAPSRVDYRDRYLAGLRPRHRAAHMRWRESGVLLPFGGPLEAFDQPNRHVEPCSSIALYLLMSPITPDCCFRRRGNGSSKTTPIR